MKLPKVFGIGFHKTGTKSLAEALRRLGYRVTGPNGTGDEDIAGKLLPMTLALAEQFDGFQDNPWPLVYREMDRQFPGSKFVLTLRPMESWVGSVVRHFGTKTTPMRRLMYGAGSPLGNEAIYIERHKRHIDEVRDYFRDRPQDFLTLRITEGEGWQQLCPFLGRPVPESPFPHRNPESVRAPKG
jgi:hypothetical protein